ncbi:MAG: hypothetical protein LUE98_08370 [Tannerellaceae bacterium]|nr:hypothetical protein [Tannerellaceae bacterium]
MKLDNLKATWQEYNEKLDRNLRLNEELLRRMNMKQSHKEVKSILSLEYLNIGIGIVVIIPLVIMTLRVYTEIPYLITGFIALVSFIITLYNNIHKVKALSGVNYYSSPVLDVQKAIVRFEQIYYKAKKTELILIPFILISVLPIFNRGINGIDEFTNPREFLVKILICLVICIPLSFWTYRHYYEKRIARIHEFLNSIEEFEKE